MNGGSAGPVLLYDGVCGVCNRAVRTILRLDPTGPLRFAALDSVFAKAVIERHPEIADIDSVVFVDDPGRPSERVAVRSESAMRVVDYLGDRGRCSKPPASCRLAYATGSTTGSPPSAIACSASTTAARCRRRRFAPASSRSDGRQWSVPEARSASESFLLSSASLGSSAAAWRCASHGGSAFREARWMQAALVVSLPCPRRLRRHRRCSGADAAVAPHQRSACGRPPPGNRSARLKIRRPTGLPSLRWTRAPPSASSAESSSGCIFFSCEAGTNAPRLKALMPSLFATSWT